MDDVMQVVSNIKNYLIAFGVVLVLALIVMFAVRKKPKAKKKLIRAQSGVAILLALAIVANLICTGPMSTMLDLVSVSGTISEETSAEATQLVNEITQEGVVLAQNDDNILPVASGSKLNVFGWSSTNPCYGGTGSGALNDAYPVTDLLTGLHDAGIETNDELSKFYTDYYATRPTVGMSKQDWTLPEPNVNLYTNEMMENAKNFSDTAMVVITRVGGEGADLPTDMAAVAGGNWIRRVAEYRGNEKGAGYYNGTYDDTLNGAMIGMQATTSCSCPTVRKNSSTLLPQTLIMSLLFTTVQTLSRWVGSRITPRSKAFCSVPAPVSLALRALAASFLVRSAPLDVPLIPMLRI